MIHMSKWFYLVIAAAMVLSAAGCQPPAARAEARSEKPRVTNPVVDEADWVDFVAGNRAFTLDMYHQLAAGEQNLFFSPYSISTALAMTYAGARNATEAQMAQVLHTRLPQDRYHAVLNALDQSLVLRAEQANKDARDSFQMNIANAVWGQHDFTFLPEYLDVLAEYYGAGMRLVDFAGAPDPSRLIINRWVEDQTNQKIKDLLPEGSVQSDTRLVLTNAIYFKASWLKQFEASATHQAPFTLLDGSIVNVDMMFQDSGMQYTSGKGYQLVGIPYAGGQASMVILLPAEGNFSTFEESLTADTLAGMLAEMHHEQVQLSLPRFKLETKFEVADPLKALGMTDAFDTGMADFSGMDGRKDLYITGVYHQAFVDVNEKGTEAAAATGVVVGLTSMPMEPAVVEVNRPFIFLIYDHETETILFMGRVMNP